MITLKHKKVRPYIRCSLSMYRTPFKCIETLKKLFCWSGKNLISHNDVFLESQCDTHFPGLVTRLFDII